MSEQPEALRVAEALEQQFPLGTAQHFLDGEAARLLREQHAEIERLRDALKKYGQHRNDCAVTLGGYQCTCGFNQQEQPR